MMAYCQEVILNNSKRGKGSIESPVRSVLEIWAKDGTLLAVQDPCAPRWNETNQVYVLPDGEQPPATRPTEA